MKNLGKCKSCTTKENIATTRKDDAAYTHMVKTMQANEQTKHERSGIPKDQHYTALSLMQESDIRHLVDVIWCRQSAISSSKNIEELILTRWDPRCELSPWNCILLTKAEAATHDKQGDPVDLYSDEFKSNVSRKHLVARQYFSQLPAIERFIRKNPPPEAPKVWQAV